MTYVCNVYNIFANIFSYSRAYPYVYNEIIEQRTLLTRHVSISAVNKDLNKDFNNKSYGQL